MFSSGVRVLSFLALGATSVLGFDLSRTDNLAVYWGQNSYGAINPGDPANWQQNLSTYCQDSVIDYIPIAFVDIFVSTGGLPDLNLANICSANSGVFAGTGLANCQFMESQIQACQAAGKLVTISLGGAAGAGAVFSSDAQATAFATTIWNLFLGGSSSTRPFGAAVLDGVDIDIESGVSTGFAAFSNEIRALSAGANKRYYLSAAPQCPFPDASVGNAINNANFDLVMVQFYNNFCGVNNFQNPADWNFGVWDNWAKTVSPNPNVKVFIGAPASPSAANAGYYVDAATLGSIVSSTRAQYSSFGGVMLWDASQAFANNRYDRQIKNLIATAGGGGGTTTSTKSSSTATSTSTKSSSTATSTTSTKTSTSTTSSSTSTTTTISSGSCSGVAAWSSSVAYVGGSVVTYNGSLWQSTEWSQAEVPGGAAGAWSNKGPCASTRATIQAALATQMLC
ncbi:glycoside hydrolase [Roridomyces roridus]|uniref:chitinase n=1 Tax=Roridomyces roridus TaxID=1738132 RepID=A0AAD7CJH6_9AGAR|nr:glycoside hydrolase [Roridomyces roridus]